MLGAADEALVAGAAAAADGVTVADNPLLAVLNRPNVIVTPHVAWASSEAMQTLWDQTIDHVNNFKDGSPSNTLW